MRPSNQIDKLLQDLPCLDREEFDISRERSVKRQLQVDVYPDFLAILQIESNLTLRDEEIHFNNKSPLHVPKEISNLDSYDIDLNANLPSFCHNISNKLIMLVNGDVIITID